MASLINPFASTLELAFMDAFNKELPDAPIEDCIARVPSTQRVETYPGLSPAVDVGEYKGHRRFARFGGTDKTVANKPWDAAMQVLKEDVDDAKNIIMYEKMMSNLARNARSFATYECLRTLAVAEAQSIKGWDGTNFFGDNHTGGLGTGDNLMTATATGENDNNDYRMILLVKSSDFKPIFWQNREDPVPDNDMNSPEARKAKLYSFWVDFRGAAFLGMWWDAVQLTFSDKPTLGEVKSALSDMKTRMRSFRLPVANSSTDRPRRIHEQLEFTPASASLVVCTQLEGMARAVLNSDLIDIGNGTITNDLKGSAKLVVSGLLDDPDL